MYVDLIPESAAGPALTRKTAATPAERHRLAHEARLVTLAAHPGVVRLIDTDGGDLPDSLDFEMISGPTIAELGPQPLDVAVGIGAALTTTVADLHELGVYHQAIAPEHVLVDEAGRPVLCGFGRARVASEATDSTELRRKDMADLVATIGVLLPPTAPHSVKAALAKAARPRRPPRTITARQLARRMVELTPGAHLSGEPSPAEATPSVPPGQRRRATGWRISLIGAACLVVVGWIAAREATGTMRSPSVAVACPTIDDGCGPIPDPDRTVVYGARRFRLDEAGGADELVAGRWDCSTVALPAVLALDSGQIWVFAAWPSVGSSRQAVLAAAVPGASGIKVRPDSAGCDELTVERGDASPVTIEPRLEP